MEGQTAVDILKYLCVGGGAALIAIGLPTAIYLMNKADKARQHTEHQAYVNQARSALAASQNKPRGKDLTRRS